VDGTVTLKSQRFRTERLQSWKELEKLLAKIDSRGIQSLDDDQIIALPELYRSTLSSLSVARATSLDQSVITYLESLSARAYYILYGSQTGLGKRIALFFKRDWPMAAQRLWKETTASFTIVFLSTLTAFFLVRRNPDWFYAFVSDNMAQGRSPGASTESLRQTIYNEGNQEYLAAFSSFLFSHNSGVAIFAFALGFAFCIPTAFLLIATGLMLGAFLALFADHGLGMEMGGWLFIHGTTEVFAIVLAGAAGFHIGTAVAFPGQYSRLRAGPVRSRGR